MVAWCEVELTFEALAVKTLALGAVRVNAIFKRLSGAQDGWPTTLGICFTAIGELPCFKYGNAITIAADNQFPAGLPIISLNG